MNLEDRVNRVENEIDALRDAVNANAKNIAVLSADMKNLDMKINRLIDAIQNNNNIVVSLFREYKGSIEKLFNEVYEQKKEQERIVMEREKIKNEHEKYSMKMGIIDKVLMYAYRVSVIAIATVLGVKVLGWV